MKTRQATTARSSQLFLFLLALLCITLCLQQVTGASSAEEDVDQQQQQQQHQEGEKNTSEQAGAAGTGGDDGASTTSDGGGETTSATSPSSKPADEENHAAAVAAAAAAAARRKLLDENADWGQFYDPKDIFCGKYDCYKILGFDHETFYLSKPDKNDITKAYRALSRAWHPDKNKRKGAKERFVKIVRAYEVLTDKETREEYDYFRGRPDEYFDKYGSSVLWFYAPKSDARIIVVLLIAFFSWISLFIKKQRWRNVADHVIKAAVDGLGLKEGGSTESIAVRKRALEIQAERQLAQQQKLKSGTDGGAEDAKGKKVGGKKGSSGAKQTGKEKKKANQDELRSIIAELVYEIDDFGGGFRKPTWKDMFAVKLCLLPITFSKAIWWWSRYFLRRVRRMEYSDEELEFLTRKAVGEAGWDCADEEERELMKTKELWIPGNLEDYREEVQSRNLSPGDQKRYRRWKKKEGTKLE